MRKLPLKLEKRLQKRKKENSFRELGHSPQGIDFYSNDYLGLSRSREVHQAALEMLEGRQTINGATGSRLLSGNHELFERAENSISKFHLAEAALIYNSGFDANIGFFSAVPQKGDLILYDELSHASIRDGIQMSLARSYKFKHNDLKDLRQKLQNLQNDEKSEVYIVTESVFSMDGDSPDLTELVNISKENSCHLVIDEAHATGVFGPAGQGLLQQLGLQDEVFARIHTFGKAAGCHGAAILGSNALKDYLVNFSRSFIYTTALSPHAVATIIATYDKLQECGPLVADLRKKITYFKTQVKNKQLVENFVASDSSIQSCLVPGNTRVKKIAGKLAERGFLLKPILSPTVPVGSERIRFCIHSYNSEAEISEVLELLANFVAKS